MNQATTQVVVVSQPAMKEDHATQKMALFSPDGSVLNLGGSPNAYIAPTVVPVAFSTTINFDASLGNVVTCTLTASTATIENPTNPHDGQILHYVLKQDGTGGRTVSWGSAFDWGNTAGTPNSAPTLTTTLNKTDVIGFRYDAGISKWCYLSAPFPQGF